MSRQTARKRKSSVAALVERLHNPGFLRAVVTGIVLAVAYVGVFSPLAANIDEDMHKLAAQKKLLETVQDIETLRKEYATFKDRVPDKADTDEWVQYMLVGIRQFPLKLILLDPGAPKEVGPYKGIVMRIELNGQLRDMNDFLKWLESNPRLVRVDIMDIETSIQTKGALVMHLTVVGVTG
ncbi:MAG TPA: type 4a pilus biogenesis protein PilO [Pirellulales bacterium]|nr:type 4a pilus biogenesis protein PilO [Pirellulales bacterium]